MMKNVGLCSVSFRGLPPEKIIQLVKKSALGCIEWGGDIHVPASDLERAAKIGSLSRQNGILCPSYGSYYHFDEFEAFESESDCADVLGAKIIRVWAGKKDSEQYSEEEFFRLVQMIRKCARYADKHGQEIAFEYHYQTYCNTPESTAKLLAEVDEKNVGTYWQPDYWHTFSSEDERIRENIRAIHILRDKILNIHVYQWRGMNRFPLLDGKEEWETYLRLVPSGYRYLEFFKNDTIEQFESDAGTLCEIEQKTSKN